MTFPPLCPRAQGLGDLAAHLVAFHNMGASPSHEDPFTSGVKVDFSDDDGGGDAEPSEGEPAPGEPSPQPTHSGSRRPGSSLLDQDHPGFDNPGRVRMQT